MARVETYCPLRPSVEAIQWDGEESTYASICTWFDRIGRRRQSEDDADYPTAVRSPTGRLRVYNDSLGGFFWVRKGDYIYSFPSSYMVPTLGFVFAEGSLSFASKWRKNEAIEHEG